MIPYIIAYVIGSYFLMGLLAFSARDTGILGVLAVLLWLFSPITLPWMLFQWIRHGIG